MSSAARRDRFALELLAVSSWSAGFAWILLLPDPRLGFLSYLAAAGACGAAWLYLSARALRGQLHASVPIIALALGLGLRIACILTPPAHSDDVFRYLFEGRAIWTM